MLQNLLLRRVRGGSGVFNRKRRACGYPASAFGHAWGSPALVQAKRALVPMPLAQGSTYHGLLRRTTA